MLLQRRDAASARLGRDASGFVLALTSKRSAASRRDAPDSTVSSTRSRKSKEQGFGINPPPKIESMPLDSLIQTSQGIPRFNPAETCSNWPFLCSPYKVTDFKIFGSTSRRSFPQ
jgi:hypothetical protein